MTKKFKKSLHMDYQNDDLYIHASKMIGYNKPIMFGSYAKYGKDKSCDMDLEEDILDFNTSIDTRKKFLEYLKKIYNNRKKEKYFIHEINIKLKNNYIKIQEIYDLLTPINGLLEIDNSIDIQKIKKLIDNLPFELNMEISNLFNLYIKNKNLETYIDFMYGLYNRLYPQWSIEELLNGKKEYYDEKYDILDMSQEYSHFYIEIIYNNFRISNYIMFFERSIETNESILKVSIKNILNNNKISYYNYLKKVGFFLKWLYFNKKLEKYKVAINFDEYNKLFDFRNELGIINNKTCIMKNKLDLYKIKLQKYEKKKEKYNNNKYNKYIKKYNNKIKKINNIYEKNMITINDKSKKYLDYLLSIYNDEIKKYIHIF